MVKFVYKAISIKLPDEQQMYAAIEEALLDHGNKVARELEKTVENWKSAPTFKPEVFSQAGGPFGSLQHWGVEVKPTGRELDVNKWIWLDQGTRIRWALMSRDWRSKTKPGRWRPTSGRGYVVIAGRRAMTARGIGPRPGIEARNWSETIQKREKLNFMSRMSRAFTKGAYNLFRD